MISTKSLCRVSAQSLYGLVSFLCTRYPALTPDLALQRLLVAGAHLRAADPNLCFLVLLLQDTIWTGLGAIRLDPAARRRMLLLLERCSTELSIRVPHLLDPSAAQQELLGSPASVTGTLQVASFLLQKEGALSSQDVSFLSRLLSCRDQSDRREQKKAARSTNKGCRREYLSSCRVRFWGQHDRAWSKVESALDAFNGNEVSRALGFTTSSTTSSSSSAWHRIIIPLLSRLPWLKKFRYSVHVICGVNEFVSGPEFCTDEEGRGYNPWTPYKFHHAHINFLASCAGSSKPTLFFAECSNHGTDKSWCVPVEPLHPCSNMYNNNELITHNQQYVDWVHTVPDDCIYYDDGVDPPADGDDEQDRRPYVTFG
ncbi:hypothetical protein QOZ80_6AG0507290 [Eleusine coracana subsp. coracana]|nr:hypothetical protein QOZ80_6AG0507290 [Eleusine coracana subsp. coracana]